MTLLHTELELIVQSKTHFQYSFQEFISYLMLSYSTSYTNNQHNVHASVK
jgi:hypothetical protein